MDWREQWPGESTRDGGGGPASPTDAGGPVRVALKASACAAAEDVAALRDERGEYVRFASECEAAAELLDPDRPSLRFQAPAPNDPADVDAYLVKLRDPDPAPEDRGPASDGWECRMTANQVGALAETLFTAYRYDPPPIVAYVARDRGLDPDAFRVHVDPDDPPPIDDVGHDGVGDGDGVTPIGVPGRWQWDVHFAVHRRPPAGQPGTTGPVLGHYLAEVKHGSTSFERNQRAEMERIARDARDVRVLVVRVRLDGAPQTYELSITEVDG